MCDLLKIKEAIAFEPYYETKNGVLYNADCLEIMKELELDSIDLCITSPPYNKGKNFGGKGKNFVAGDWYEDNLTDGEYRNWQKKVIKLILKKSKYLIYNNKVQYRDTLAIFPHRFLLDFPIRQELIWDRASTPDVNVNKYLPVDERIFIISNHKLKLNRNSQSTIFRNTDWMKKEGEHPCPFPISLPTKFIVDFNAQIILDPFLGAGTTAVACERLNRKWIGIELNQKYCDIAVKRIEEELSQGKLF